MAVHELQRLIKIHTRNPRSLSKNRLAFKAKIDRHLIMRILSNQGLPDLRKAESIVRVLNHRLAVIPVVDQ